MGQPCGDNRAAIQKSLPWIWRFGLESLIWRVVSTPIDAPHRGGSDQNLVVEAARSRSRRRLREDALISPAQLY